MSAALASGECVAVGKCHCGHTHHQNNKAARPFADSDVAAVIRTLDTYRYRGCDAVRQYAAAAADDADERVALAYRLGLAHALGTTDEKHRMVPWLEKNGAALEHAFGTKRHRD